MNFVYKNYPYAPNKKWIKKAWGSLWGVISSAGFLLIEAVNDTLPSVLVFLAAVILLSGVWQMVGYFRMPEKDYVRLEEERMTFDKGTVLPRKSVEYEKVDKMSDMEDLILLKLRDGQEQEIHTDWLEEQDYKELRQTLSERITISNT
ncbi:hypothetical protein [Halobacillus sp. A5]|uniref:hypothetical protein n=1 Tax=Halobacillus sp. A5 TaxID=2880263 RepID=UPI0020A61D82|nr:hypothetical protein [Halobacillus sp. A5]MCP3029421.1 hypothetical protein [Halobacillus sp. A5]